ncbi:MAG TPA: hypothetical protein VFF03_14355 [Rhodocyclaceae bacterium]|nr:hypothetical protein [Rhodocyclaceae bacterium]
MREIPHVRQIPGEPKRRWFSSKDFDLILWLDDGPGFLGFELCYDKSRGEHSITWSRDNGFRHMAVDDGEQRYGKHKATPVLIPDGIFDVRRVHAAFVEASASLPPDISRFVLQALENHPAFAPGTAP